MRYLAVFLACLPLAAHDMWLEPATFLPKEGDIVAIKLRVGQDLLGDPLVYDSKLIKSFVAEDSSGRRNVVGRDGSNPAGLVRVAAAGLLEVGYYSNPSIVEQAPAKFDQYLKEEGLFAIVALRAGRKDSGSAVKELFSRCAKSLLYSGAGEAQKDKALGMPLELVAERNPYALKAGEELPVRLTWEGKPLANALVIAMNRQNPTEKIKLRTAADGRVKLPMTKGGMWLIKTVHMIPAAAGEDAEWHSYWASLTFELGAR
ncbi:MAG: DUF4198 domain-containing protein [Acidobacteriota bacterium]